MKRHKKPEECTFTVEGYDVPVRIYREFRHTVRAAIGKDAAILRLPISITPQEKEEQIERFRSWIGERARKRKGLLRRFEKIEYHNGDVVTVGKRSYVLMISEENRKTHVAKLRDKDIIEIKLNQNDQEVNRHRSIQSLLSRVISADFLPEISARVHSLNEQFFQQKIKIVRIKKTTSNWGSCSHNGAINLSSRLLFAPDDVIDYVIIHELAHLVEFNHSPKFWRLLERAMPNYIEKEKWLIRFGEELGF
ncbi:MAG TPA: M48 family metallopeptidase [Saprospiraceae bacterium]|nr:M48 family metallopeptidase [Saprospiraceae bacterium]HMQ83810.1 M48 family metallopeptidase [Saprospiraceae bacterium]